MRTGAVVACLVLAACGGGGDDDGGDDDAPSADARTASSADAGGDASQTPPSDAMTPGVDGGASDGGASDGGAIDGGATDAGGADAMAGAVDAGAPDATPAVADAGAPDAMPIAVDASTCAAQLAPTNDGTELPAGGVPDVIISELQPGTFVEVYNTTDADIVLSTPPQSGYYWCNRPFYASVSTAVTVPARSYAQLPWPGGSSTTTSGEYVLYKNASFGTGLNILDYVCWGTLPAINRNTEATSVGKWSGACAPAIPTAGSLARRVGVTGTTAASYETLATPTPMTCTGE